MHLQAEQHEQHRVEHEVERRPEGRALQPGRGGEDAAAAAEQQPRGDDGEHAGALHLLGEHVGEVGGEQRQQQLQPDVVQPAAHRQHQERDDRADPDAAGHREPEALQGGPRSRRAAADGLQRDAEQHQRGRVVDQALALDDVHDRAGRAEPPEDPGGGDRVGRRDDGAEHQALGQPEPRDQRAHHERDGEGGRQDEAERQQRQRGGDAAQGARVGEERAPVDQRRQEHQEDEVGRQLPVGGSRQQPGERPDDDEHHRVGQAGAAGEGDAQQHDDAEGEAEQGERVGLHGRALPRRPGAQACRAAGVSGCGSGRPGPRWPARPPSPARRRPAGRPRRCRGR